MDSMELHRKYRPQHLEEVFGQKEVVDSLQSMLEEECLPHTLLFTGPAGVGKTSLARILAKALKVHKNSIIEINCADKRGIDDAREIIEHSKATPLFGNTKAFILDEFHHASKRADADAQTTLLKVLEEPPNYCYFFLCTTHPEDLLPTVRSRCTIIQLKSISDEAMEELLKWVCHNDGINIKPPVMEALIKRANGCARDALKWLQQVANIKDVEEQVALLEPEAENSTVDKLIKMLVYEPTTKWKDVQDVLNALPKDVDWEQLRWSLLGAATGVLLKPGGKEKWTRADLLITVCRDNWWNCKKAGLVQACYTIFGSK